MGKELVMAKPLLPDELLVLIQPPIPGDALSPKGTSLPG